MMQKKFTLYNFETFRSRDHGSVPVITGAACDVITGAACDVITGAACDVITGTFPIGGFWYPTERYTIADFLDELPTAITWEPFVRITRKDLTTLLQDWSRTSSVFVF